MSVMIVLTTLFCVLPYLYFMLMGNYNTKKKEKLFKDAIKGENLTLNNKEQWNDSFIGLDESRNILIFIKLVNQEPTILKVDLKQITTCQINRKTREFKKEKKMESELQSLDLELTIQSKGEPITFNFYDIVEEFSENLELKRAEKWQTLILQGRDISIFNKRAA
ncbi:hypothetical protein SAMN03097699_0665 [Flavobacteriaceae bacterium MAR_2010_188]|nr:hypothetical protein SAMN03097699_0665 [Flavobacteriaceae bacterium MAR_2010_188]